MSTRRTIGRMAAFLAVGSLAAACGGGVSLEAWAESADEICADLVEELEEASAAEAEDLVEDAVEELEALEAPGGEDGDAVEDAIDALADAVEASVDALGDLDGDDELAALEQALRGADVDDEVEVIEETGADECAEAAETAPGETVGELRAVSDLLDDLADLRVGDCVLIDPELAEIDCDDDDAQGEIILTVLSEPDCPDEANVTQTVERSNDDAEATLGLCIVTFEEPVDPEDTDNFLVEGSCANVVEQTDEDGGFTVNELPCDDPDATHVVVDGVQSGSSCLAGEINFSTSQAEEEEFGFRFWCAEPL